MELHLLEGRECGGYTTFGAVWSRGEKRSENFILTNEMGERVPVQSRVQARWPDGSVKWSAHTADSRKMGRRVRLTEAGDKVEQKAETMVHRNGALYLVDTGKLSLEIPLPKNGIGRELAGKILLHTDVDGRKEEFVAKAIYPVFLLERRYEDQNDWQKTMRKEYRGIIQEVTLEENGPLQAVFCFRGAHVEGEDCQMPFVIRLYLGKDSAELRVVHTMLYDGKEERDYLGGMGIRIEAGVGGEAFNRHVQYAVEGDPFHEMGQTLASNHPRLDRMLEKRQLQGERIDPEKEEQKEEIYYASENLPIWNSYFLYQDSSEHFLIGKRTGSGCCELIGRHGRRAEGAMAVGGIRGTLLCGIRDFWQKNPSGLEVENLCGQEKTECTLWFYAPKASAYDFRHYDVRSYPDTCYEGFKEVGASAFGIGVTSECRIALWGSAPSNEEVQAFGRRMQKPPVYIGDPVYYHQKRAFGYYSLPGLKTEAERKLEKQLDRAFAFYRREVEARKWYGLFDYGDVMHSYDTLRHTWKYDVGGYAWDNTELVPTYWLWLYFLRTGREDVFSMAEALSRHASEVDIYHFGPNKGLGSRHNVRHWGCSCKEPRVSMAGHHRFLLYLTGDERLGEIVDLVRDADWSASQNIYMMAQLPDGSRCPAARSGPDWSSYVSNWITWYERTGDETYRRKIETGIEDLARTPFGLISGPDFHYDPNNGHLIYCGESEYTPNQHLQICMGGPQVWLETADALENDALRRMLVELGAFYFLDSEEKSRRTGGKIEKRHFDWPMFATGIAAYSAMCRKDRELAKQTWKILLENLEQISSSEGFGGEQGYARAEDGSPRCEIPGISTNTTAQWCLNTIMCLEFIRDALPEAEEKMQRRKLNIKIAQDGGKSGK